jgi:hypothetical protein
VQDTEEGFGTTACDGVVLGERNFARGNFDFFVFVGRFTGRPIFISIHPYAALVSQR